MCETVRMGFDTPDRKYVSSVNARIDCGSDSECEVLIEYDGDGEWHSCGYIDGAESSHFIRIRPARCDYFKLRFEGEGDFTIRSITRTLESCGSFL